MRSILRVPGVASLLVVAACGGGAAIGAADFGGGDGGANDGAAPLADAGTGDVAATDARDDRGDATSADAGPPKIDAVVEPPIVLASTGMTPPALGTGIDASTLASLGPCAVGSADVEYVPLDQRVFDFDQNDVTVDALASTLDARSSPILLAPQAELMPLVTAIAADDRATNALSIVTIDEGVRRLGGQEHERSDAAPGACASEYVAAHVLGARLVVGLRLTFDRASDRLAFTAKWGRWLNQIVARPDAAWASVDLAGKAKIQIVALQVGLDATKLAELARGSACSIGDLPACARAYDALHAYARAFVAQAPEPDAKDARGWAIVGASLVSTPPNWR